MSSEQALHEVGDHVWAYVQRDGGWGWSNAGLVVDGETSLLVDTLFDLRLTAEMLEAMRRASSSAEHVDLVVNTHANGDHCYGNQLVAGAEIVASTASAEEMAAVPPSLLAGFVAAAPDLPAPLGEYLTAIFGEFSFEGIEVIPPTRTFTGSLSLHVGDRQVDLYELGPAHTGGDVAVHVPDTGIVFTGDLVFHGGHPIVWAGPVSNWITACDRLLALEPAVVVPGHGPIGDRACIEAERAYLTWIVDEGTPRLEGGMSPPDAARDLASTGSPFDDWSEGERLVVNLTALARDLGQTPPDDVVSLFGQMAERWAAIRSEP